MYMNDTLAGAAVHKSEGALGYSKQELLNDTLFMNGLALPEVKSIQVLGNIIIDDNRMYLIDEIQGDSIFRIDGKTLYLYDIHRDVSND